MLVLSCIFNSWSITVIFFWKSSEIIFKTYYPDLSCPRSPAISKWIFLIKILPPLFQEFWLNMHSGVMLMRENLLLALHRDFREALPTAAILQNYSSYCGQNHNSHIIHCGETCTVRKNLASRGAEAVQAEHKVPWGLGGSGAPALSCIYIYIYEERRSQKIML